MADTQQPGKLEQQRLEKLEKIKELGVDPYGQKYEGVETAEAAKSRFVDDDDSLRANCAGRIVLLRDIGKLIFITLRDCSGTIQIGLSKKLLAEKWDLVNKLCEQLRLAPV